MKKLATAQEIREMDRRTIIEIGIPGLLLMEAASKAVADNVCDMLERPEGKEVTLLCGRGNNGGDGLAAARHLFLRGMRVSVYLAGDIKTLQGDALANCRMLGGLNIPVHELRIRNDLRKIRPGDLIVDALLGTGMSGPVEGFYAEVIKWINGSERPVLSVDIPSGLSADSGQITSVCVSADRTVTFGELKRGLVLHPGREQAGRVVVADIGIPESVASSVGVSTFWLEQRDVVLRLPKRPEWAHKGVFGKVAVIAGSRGMTGAAVLCSSAVMRAGAGLAVLAIPASLYPLLVGKPPEIMTKPLAETPAGSLSSDAEHDIQGLIDWADVLAIGPGISRHPETSDVARKIVLKNRKPVVLDADGINAFEGHTVMFEKIKGNKVLTPHSGELSRIIGIPIEQIEKDRIETARNAAQRFRCVLVLKGSPTVIAEPDGRVWVNSSGNSGMATAGAGDVLTGVIAGLLAQGISIQDAAVCGVYLHGLAGDIAATEKSGRAMMAGDITDALGKAFQHVEKSV
jgi:hydroxyethylthiazole kinase-like uncharacterized protein yjeF